MKPAIFFSNMLFGGLMLACSSVEKPHSIPTAAVGNPVAVPAANDPASTSVAGAAGSVSKTDTATAASIEALNPAAVVSSTCGPGCTCGAACNCKTPLECLQVAAASPPAPVSSPALAPALPAATGHYEQRSVRVGLRNWQNQWVWIPAQARQPVYQYQAYGGSCSGGRCR